MAVASIYQQASEPTDLKPGTIWLGDDGVGKIRKLDGTWNTFGPWQEPNFGLLSLQGGTMLGPILGAHGLATLESPAFTGTPTINAVDAADKDFVTSQVEALKTSLTALISNQFGGTAGNITIGGNLAVGYGTVADGGTIPLPTYADNTRAAKAEVWGVMVSMATMPFHDGAEANDSSFNIAVDVNLNVTCQCVESHWGTKTGTANYIILCKR